MPIGRRDAYAVLTAPIVILVGHFGSGKSEIALNLAFGMRERGRDVTLVDLDVVKPYFRCRLAREELQAKGIQLVAPEGDRFFADLPIIVPQVRGALSRADNTNARVIVDAGGDDLGPGPYELLLSALGACKAMTLFMYGLGLTTSAP